VENRSSLTSRTMAQIAAAGDRHWQSNRSTRKVDPFRRANLQPRSKFTQTRISKEAKIGFIEPMKARLAAQLPVGKNWLYEIKFDGVRALAMKQGSSIQLISRSAKDLTAKYSELAEKLAGLPVETAIVDGEVVALDSEGRPSFQLLQCYHMPGQRKPPLFYYAFDLIHLDGNDLCQLPLFKRKAALKELLAGFSERIRFSGELQGAANRLVEQMRKRGLEGLIAKQKDSKYEAGKRSGAWIKYKWANEQEFVIGGYTNPKGSRTHFGAVLVGYYETERFIFAGKVGTGFNEKLLSALFKRFQQLRIPDCPFANLPERGMPHGRGLSTAEMRRCTWVKPELVCQVRFAEWTRDGHLRQPAFLGLRHDKVAREVVREKPAG
jgi:bifunctional non-homologous end joining protein LigD